MKKNSGFTFRISGSLLLVGVAATLSLSGELRADDRKTNQTSNNEVINAPYKDASQPLEKRVTDLLGRMTLQEKVALVTAGKGCARLELPSYVNEHGPFGFKGRFGSEKEPMLIGTYFPVSIAMASTWDQPMVSNITSAMGAEMKAAGGMGAAGPAMNIIRDPRAGRSFEYFTEDPFLNGGIATAYTLGLQSQKVMACLKHFACNNQELNRHAIDVLVSERALREIYLPGFKAAIQDGGAWSVMAAYNLLNGTHCCENPFLLMQALRKDWGFKGFVMSDWAGTHSTEASATAGLDLEMPSELWYGKKLEESVKTGKLPEATLDTMVGNILRSMFWCGAFDSKPSLDKSILANPEHLKIARAAAADSMVLLKNDKAVLPFDLSKIKQIAVIGPNGNYGPQYNNGRYDAHLLEGGGSSYLSVPQERLVTPFQGIQTNAGTNVRVVYAPGCYAENGCGTIPPKYLRTPDGKQEGLLASYYNNAKFSGSPAKLEVDTQISHSWKKDLPIPEAGRSQDDGSRFSVAWNGTVHPPETRDYTFSVRNYSGQAKLFVNGKLLASNERGSRRNWNEAGTIRLKEGHAYDIRLEYAKTADFADVRLEWDYENNAWMKQALALAKESDAVILTVGLSGESGETEAGDRKKLRLFPAQEKLIREISQANKKTAVVLIAGSAIDTRNWMDDVPAILMAWYPGEQGGNGLADVLFGKADPGGRLPITFPTSLKQYPEDYYSFSNTIAYNEGIFVGYRYFDKHQLEPLFPFGYGMSYTSFSYGKPTLMKGSVKIGEPVMVSLNVTNTGGREGSEVVQLYVHEDQCSVARPPKELKAFQKISLKPGESKKVTFTLDKHSFAYFSEKKKDWVVEPGKFDLLIGSSSRDVRRKVSVTMNP
jgi:beta-glucosidase